MSPLPTSDSEEPLFTPHYWQIRSIESDARLVSDPRAWQSVDSEVRRQLDRLGLLLDDLNARLGRLAHPGAHLAVLDTNVLMHYQPIDQIPWPDVLGLTPVRLVIPLRVIEEIDAKKYARRDEFAQRARELLPSLERLLGPAGQPGQIAGGVSVEVPVDDGPRFRPDDADEEILETCRELSQFSRQPVSLITGDTGIRLRAQVLGITAARPPHKYRR
jgi:rRNA-processing protein FCF1